MKWINTPRYQDQLADLERDGRPADSATVITITMARSGFFDSGMVGKTRHALEPGFFMPLKNRFKNTMNA